MTWGMVAVAGATLVGGIYASNQASKAANNASGAQIGADQSAIGEQQRQFDTVRQLLAPYVTAGNGALTGQQNLLGLNGNDAQQQAYSAIQGSPAFTAPLAAGNRNILANASATGGLRGGNTQGALGQFAPSLLASIIQQQYGNLAGLSQQGQNAAAGTGSAAMATGNNVSNLLVGQGNSAAGNALAQGQAQTGYANALSGAVGTYFGYGGVNRPTTGATPAVSYGSNPGGYNGTLNNPSAYVGGPF